MKSKASSNTASIIAGLLVFVILLATESTNSLLTPTTSSAYPVPGDVVSPPRLSSLPFRVNLPQIANGGDGGSSSAPIATRSRYMGNDYVRDAFGFGQFAAQQHPNGIVILAFGQPFVQNGIPGTFLPGSLNFAPIDLFNSDADIRLFLPIR